MRITLDSGFYTHSALSNMAQQFSDFMSVEYVVGEEITVTMSVKEEHQAERTLIINTFLNNILELSIQDIMNHERKI